MKTPWYQLVISTEATSNNLAKIMKMIVDHLKLNFIILNDIQGTGENWLIHILQNHEDHPLRIKDFMSMLNDVHRFEWGDFFLFQSYPENWDSPERCDYSFLINQTDTTLRAIDQGYIYIYTPDELIVQMIKENYDIESFKIDSLDRLDYPY